MSETWTNEELSRSPRNDAAVPAGAPAGPVEGEPQLAHCACFVGGAVLCMAKALSPLGCAVLINRETETW